MGIAAPAVRTAPAAPKVPEGWTALWDDDEQDWYFYHPKTKCAQWESPLAQNTRRCGLRRFLPACFFPSITASDKGKAAALPSEATLQAIDKTDRAFHDEEIAMVLQHEEFSQDLSGRRHSFDQHWIDPTEFNYKAGPSTPAVQPITAVLKSSIAQPSQPRTGKKNEQEELPAVCQQRECGICMDDDDDGDAEWTWLQCTHQFHKACVEDWLKKANRCPVCRTEFS